MKAMILAAGRGQRMRPLTDRIPKPLLLVAGKPLIVWQIEKLAAAGFTEIVINHAWLGAQIEEALGDGARWHVNIVYSGEGEPLETAGGIAKALPFLRDGGNDTAFVCVSGDIFSDYDYANLLPRLDLLSDNPLPGMHLVMVPNPDFNPQGDFALNADGFLALHGTNRYTFANIGIYDTRIFAGIVPGTCARMRPFYDAAIAAGLASGELFGGVWENLGTVEQLRALNDRLEIA